MHTQRVFRFAFIFSQVWFTNISYQQSVALFWIVTCWLWRRLLEKKNQNYFSLTRRENSIFLPHTKSCSCKLMRLLRFTGCPSKNQCTWAAGCESTKHSILACSPGRVWTTGFVVLISGATGRRKIKIVEVLPVDLINWLTIYDEKNSSCFWFSSNTIVCRTLDPTSHVVVFHFNRQPTIAIISVCYMHSVVVPGNNWIRNAVEKRTTIVNHFVKADLGLPFRFTRYLKHRTQCDIHCSRRKSYNLWLNYVVKRQSIN